MLFSSDCLVILFIFILLSTVRPDGFGSPETDGSSCTGTSDVCRISVRWCTCSHLALLYEDGACTVWVPFAFLLQIDDIALVQNDLLVSFVVFCQLSPTDVHFSSYAFEGIAFTGIKIIVVVENMYGV